MARTIQQTLANATMMNPLDHPICLTLPHRLTPLSAWHEHIPFGMFVVDLLKPRVIVELGTHFGDSYCAFCQAVKELQLSTRCYAIDTWKGDVHTGPYGLDVLAGLRDHHDPLYGSFSQLIPSLFAEALPHFADDTIDLLHIDAYHTYEAVRQDFYSWLPKLSRQGVVLFHDTNVRERGFGVWKFWAEIRQAYPHVEFLHGSGLGVLAVGPECPAAFQNFLEVARQNVIGVRDLFYQLGRRLTLQVQAQALGHELRDATSVLQVFWGTDNDYLEEDSVTARLLPDGNLHEYMLSLPATANGQFRFDPVNGSAYVEIDHLALYRQAADEGEESLPLVRWSVDNDFAGLQAGAELVRLSGRDTYRLICPGDDPQIMLGNLPELKGDTPLRLKIVMSVSWEPLKPALAELAKSHKQLHTQLGVHQMEIEKLHDEVRLHENVQNEHLLELEGLRTQLRALADERAAEIEGLHVQLHTLEGVHAAEIEKLRAQLRARADERAASLSELERLRQQLRERDIESERRLAELQGIREDLRRQSKRLAELDELRAQVRALESEGVNNLAQLDEAQEQLKLQASMATAYLAELKTQEIIHAGEVAQLHDELAAAVRAPVQADESAALAARLTNTQAQSAQTEAQLLEITNSRLWKLLSPLQRGKPSRR